MGLRFLKCRCWEFCPSDGESDKHPLQNSVWEPGVIFSLVSASSLFGFGFPETGCHSVAQAGSKLMILLPGALKCLVPGSTQARTLLGLKGSK